MSRRPLTTALAAAVALAALAATGAGTAAGPDDSWIVLASNRDGGTRAYSVLPDGTRLTPLFPAGRALEPLVVSGDGGTVAYVDDTRSSLRPWDDAVGAISISHGDGTGLRLLVPAGSEGTNPTLSRDGRLMAFRRLKEPSGIFVVGTDGRGLRRFASFDACGCGRHPVELSPVLSPDGKAVVYVGENNDRYAIVVRPLDGKARVLVRARSWAEDAFRLPTWSPDGRWIAYFDFDDDRRRNGLWLVRPNGQGLHRVAREAGLFAWSPTGDSLAFAGCGGVCIAGLDGRLRRLPLGGLAGPVHALAWSPDASRLALQAGLQLWVVGSDGSDLRAVTTEGASMLVGWTRLAPWLPAAAPLPQGERALAANTLATRAQVTALAADGPSVAVALGPTAIDCDHVAVWTPDTKAVVRFGTAAPCGRVDAHRILDLALAGSRAAWVTDTRNSCEYTLYSATLADARPAWLDGYACKPEDYHVHGHGHLLVFVADRRRLVRIGVGNEACAGVAGLGASICTTVRRASTAVDSLAGGRIALREPAAVTVLDARGKLVRAFSFKPADVYAARLDGAGRLVVARSSSLEAYDVATGRRTAKRRLAAGYELTDADGGVAVLRRPDRLLLLRLADGRSFELAPGGRVLGDLEPGGLYYAFGAGGGGRVAFVPRDEVARRLGV